MIENGSHKRIGGMAVTTVISGRYVINVFTRAEIPVMTRRTGNNIDDSRIMIKDTRHKGTRGVTNTAIRGGWKVSGRLPKS